MQDIAEITFAYDDTETRIVVEQRYSEVQSLMRHSLTELVEAGGKFAEIRRLLRHNKSGGFDGWLQSKSLAKGTAYRLMDLHQAFGGQPSQLGQLDIDKTAAYLLAAPSTPETARIEAIQRAESGETIRFTTAQEIVETHKALPAFATLPELEAGVRAWLEEGNPGNSKAQASVLKQITLDNSPVGPDIFNRLIQSPQLPALKRRSDVAQAANNVYDQMRQQTTPAPARAVVYSPAADGDETPAGTPDSEADLPAGWMPFHHPDGRVWAINQNAGQCTPICATLGEVLTAIDDLSHQPARNGRSVVTQPANNRSTVRTCPKCGRQYRGHVCPKCHPAGGSNGNGSGSGPRAGFRASDVLGRSEEETEAPAEDESSSPPDAITELVAAAFEHLRCLQDRYGAALDEEVGRTGDRLYAAAGAAQDSLLEGGR